MSSTAQTLFLKVWPIFAVAGFVAIDSGLATAVGPRQHDAVVAGLSAPASLSDVSDATAPARDSHGNEVRRSASNAIYFWPAPLSSYRYFSVGEPGAPATEPATDIARDPDIAKPPHSEACHEVLKSRVGSRPAETQLACGPATKPRVVIHSDFAMKWTPQATQRLG